MRTRTKTGRLSADSVDGIFAECRSFLEQHRLAQEDIDPYLESVARILDCCREHFGANAEIAYRLRKHYGRIVLRLTVPGEKFNPLQAEMETADTGQSVQQALNRLVWNQDYAATYTYRAGFNIISIATAPIDPKSIYRSPMLWGAFLGLICGLICLQLPDALRAAIVDDIATPVRTVCLGMLTGVMGPVVFFSMITAISALGSINDLTDLGFTIVRRFIAVTLAVMAVGIAVSLLFYNVTGAGGIDFQVEQIVDLVLGIIPTNILSPLLEGNIPQLVVLSVALGAALLVLENRVDGLKDTLAQVHEWIMSLMDIIMVIVPAIPFLSIFITVAKGSGTDLLNGWEFIVASYLAATICGACKLAKVSLKYKVAPNILWRKLKPLVNNAFATSNNTTMVKLEYEISERDLGIKPEFSALWVPMAQAMLNPRSTLMLVIPPFLILKYTGMPISTSFLLVLVIMVLQLSIASPGTTGGWTILFAALGFPADYVGIFLAYRLACANYNAAYGALQAGLEQIESADKFDAIDLDRLREETVAE